MRSYELDILRHGLTEGNLSGRYVGRHDLPVCPEGFSRMEQMVKIYPYPHVDRVYVSPMLRCRQTADAIYPGVPATVVEEIAEMSFGEFEGQLISEVSKMPSFQRWLADSLHNAPPGGESGEAFHQRILAGFERILRDMMHNRLMRAGVVTHGGVIMALFSTCAFPRLPMPRWAVENLTGYTIRAGTQMWMRDRAFEVSRFLPPGCAPAAGIYGFESEEP